MKTSPAANDNLIKRTCRLWQPRMGRDLGREDARQIAENVTGFFAILAEWSRTERLAAANDNKAHVAPNGGEASHDRGSRGQGHRRAKGRRGMDGPLSGA